MRIYYEANKHSRIKKTRFQAIGTVNINENRVHSL